MDVTGPVWREVPSFGVRPEEEPCVVRDSAYALIRNDRDLIAIVQTNRGVYLPGGGIEAGETAEEAITRETFEERGLAIRPAVWMIRALQFVYSDPEKTHFEKRSVFIEALVEKAGPVRLETDHRLEWVSVATAIQSLSHAKAAAEQRQN